MKKLMENIRKRILNWLFGTDNVKRYMELLNESIYWENRYIDKINSHLETLNNQMEDVNNVRKLIKICENHGINVDEEIKKIKL